MRNHLCIILWLLLCGRPAWSQSTRPDKLQSIEIGKSFPPLQFQDVHNYTTPALSLFTFKDRWTILFFWDKDSRWCVTHLAEVTQWKREFGNDVQFIQLAEGDSLTRAMYKKYRDYYRLDVPQVFDNGVMKRLSISAVPFFIIIDPKGITRALTPILDRRSIEAFMSGSNPPLNPPADNIKALSLKEPLSAFANGSFDTQYYYRSLLTFWKPPMSQALSDFSSRYNWSVAALRNGIQEVGADLNFLYMIAYFGVPSFFPVDSLFNTCWKKPVLELKNISEFAGDFTTGKNIFNYSLIVPPSKSNNKDLQRMMQRDLKNYFGYEASFEMRTMPVWILLATKKAKEQLKTRGGFSSEHNYHYGGGLELQNAEIKWLIANIYLYHQAEPPIIDKTGITNNIDIKIEAVMADLQDVRRALYKKGLKLVRGSQKMKVLVIRPPKAS